MSIISPSLDKLRGFANGKGRRSKLPSNQQHQSVQMTFTDLHIETLRSQSRSYPVNLQLLIRSHGSRQMNFIVSKGENTTSVCFHLDTFHIILFLQCVRSYCTQMNSDCCEVLRCPRMERLHWMTSSVH